LPIDENSIVPNGITGLKAGFVVVRPSAVTVLGNPPSRIIEFPELTLTPKVIG
jgi:hypothetical protein